jgi:hypothetical protein
MNSHVFGIELDMLFRWYRLDLGVGFGEAVVETGQNKEYYRAGFFFSFFLCKHGIILSYFKYIQQISVQDSNK